MTPILYSFRRCPYAMRARLALIASGLKIKVRELILRDKPAHMLDISPKGTVPVLWLGGDQVIAESLEIMDWALAQSDPAGWLNGDVTLMRELIAANDGPFKRALDRYKYPTRYLDEAIDPAEQREIGLDVLRPLNARLAAHPYLFSATPNLADMAIFPFVRQFAQVDRAWFDALKDFAPLQSWLEGHLKSTLFQKVMIKYPLWQETQSEPWLGEAFAPTPQR
ncbi:glutathione S-transferase [Woodsholea maritima]|uniref:glutathione S-transferase n=1 Tax=Woodsholea maritima TaxID=240237 RepID=UPI00037C1E8D|nr:glutathione S-transferase [Woodsholea maritima]